MKKPIKKQQGFSLVELMIVVAVIGTLTAIAIPQYQDYQDKSTLIAAKASLTNLKSIIEADITEKNGFPTDTAALTALGATPFDSITPEVSDVTGKAGTVSLTIPNVGTLKLVRAATGGWTCSQAATSVTLKGCTSTSDAGG